MAEFIVTVLFGVMQGSIYAAVALGLVVIFGVSDIVNFAHGEFVTFGAFGIILLTPVIGFPLALLLTLAVIAFFAVFLYDVGFKHTVGNHLQALVFSLALLLIISNLMISEFSMLARRGPSLGAMLRVEGWIQISWTRIVVLVALLLLVGAAYWLLQKSWVGVALRATGSDRFAAATIGLSARRVTRYAFVASGILGAAAGIAIASINPVTPLTGVGFLLKGFVVVIIGGLTSFGGTLVAALAFGVLEAMGARYIDPALTNVYGFVLMIVVLLWKPEGLFHSTARRV